MKKIALTLCLMMPFASFAADPVAPAPAVPDVPVASSLTPNAGEAPQPQLVPNEHARYCGGTHGCHGGGGGALIVTGTVLGTVLTAVAVGVAVSFATHHDSPTVR
jgi:hypothetical protein